jgi:hypothetical protein
MSEGAEVPGDAAEPIPDDLIIKQQKAIDSEVQ